MWEVLGSYSGDYEENDRISGFMLGLLIDPEDRGDTLHRNVRELHGVTTQKRLHYKYQPVNILRIDLHRVVNI
jgi:hypothetical protein